MDCSSECSKMLEKKKKTHQNNKMLKTVGQCPLKSDIWLWRMFDQSDDGCSLVCCQDKLLLHISGADHVFAVMIELLKKNIPLSSLNCVQTVPTWNIIGLLSSIKTHKVNRLDPSQRLFCSSKWICPLRAGSTVPTQLFLLEQTKEFTSNEVAGCPGEAVSE